MTISETGTFTISLDTELAWGMFDTEAGYQSYEEAYRRTPDIVRELCSLFEKYKVPATWAVVAHLFEDCDQKHENLPTIDFNWIDDWYGSLPCLTGVPSELWYSHEIIDTIASCSVEQDIGLHGYSHLILGESECSRDMAKKELELATSTLEKHGISPSSFVFPRNKIGHLDVLADYGIDVYRGRDQVWFERNQLPRTLRKPFRYLNEALKWTPPAVTARRTKGIVEIPGSQVFRPFHDGWQYTPEYSQVDRAIKGIRRSISTGRIFHLRFHPFDLGFQPNKLLLMLEEVLKYAAQKRESGDLEICSLSDLASDY